MEPNSPKKIQFAVPLFQSQIAPEAAEQIRKRRPTPASLVILNEHNPPGKEACCVSRSLMEQNRIVRITSKSISLPKDFNSAFQLATV
ncbi:Protein phosphatase 1 regulatory subunit 1C [Myotis davidii]|uniref:Protein phosphatase 1 regulatory subunit 1C n=1 Tax=Myotis davidii TaxID=225400 RepID=L5M352_MYODS|nr:Protein phosphatase 1 regulatory subunit 1C [Myotis davidii]